MASIAPKTSFPAGQIVAVGSSALTNTASPTTIAVPPTQNGQRPTYVFVSCFQLGSAPTVAAAHVRFSPTATAATCTTGDTIVSSSQGLWMNTLGMNALSALGVTGNVRVQVSPMEEGVVVSSGQPTSGLG